MERLAVTAIGRDRPGIVAAVSGALFELEGNVEDSRMAILGGQFAVMLVVSVSGDTSVEEVEERLAEVGRELGLAAVAVAPVGDFAGSTPPSHVLTVYGADHPGIVHAVASCLAELDVNVTDLSTQVAGGAERPVYVMVIEIAVPQGAAERVEERLAEVARRIEVEVALRPLGAEPL